MIVSISKWPVAEHMANQAQKVDTQQEIQSNPGDPANIPSEPQDRIEIPPFQLDLSAGWKHKNFSHGNGQWAVFDTIRQIGTPIADVLEQQMITNNNLNQGTTVYMWWSGTKFRAVT